MGDGLMDLAAAASYTGRTRPSLRRLYQRGLLTSAGVDDDGRLLFSLNELMKLVEPGRPSQLLAA